METRPLGFQVFFILLERTLQVGFEPTTRWLTAICSTPELLKRYRLKAPLGPLFFREGGTRKNLSKACFYFNGMMKIDSPHIGHVYSQRTLVSRVYT